MVDATIVGPDWLRKRPEAASPDLLREMVATFIAAAQGDRALAPAEAPAAYGGHWIRSARSGLHSG